MEKGKLIRCSSPPSKGAIAVGLFFFIFGIFGFIIFLMTSIFYPKPIPVGERLSIFIVGFLALLSSSIYMPFYKWGQGFRIYENGVTLPYSNFFNWYHGYKKEGKFLPYWKILGYDGESLQPKKPRKKRKIKKRCCIYNLLG